MKYSLAIEEHYGGEYLGYGYTHEDFMFTEATDLNHAWICARFCENNEHCLFYETYTNHDATIDEDLSLCLLYGIMPDEAQKNDHTICNDHPFGGPADSAQLDYGYTEEDIDHHPTMDHVGHYQFLRDGCPAPPRIVPAPSAYATAPHDRFFVDVTVRRAAGEGAPSAADVLGWQQNLFSAHPHYVAPEANITVAPLP